MQGVQWKAGRAQEHIESYGLGFRGLGFRV